MTTTADETTLWKGSPSQWTNLGVYFFCLVLAAAVIAGYLYYTPREPLILTGLAIPLLWAFARWIQTRSHIYEITTERVRISTGLLSRTTTEIELYRVRDYTLDEPLLLRLIGRGNIILDTADRTNPRCIIRAVPHPARLKDQIRTQTERLRQIRGVRDLEINPQ